jgi:hypothetical protein
MIERLNQAKRLRSKLQKALYSSRVSGNEALAAEIFCR